jgi:hypothetical protein
MRTSFYLFVALAAFTGMAYEPRADVVPRAEIKPDDATPIEPYTPPTSLRMMQPRQPTDGEAMLCDAYRNWEVVAQERAEGMHLFCRALNK